MPQASRQPFTNASMRAAYMRPSPLLLVPWHQIAPRMAYGITGAILPLKNCDGPRHMPAIPGNLGRAGTRPPFSIACPAVSCHAFKSV